MAERGVKNLIVVSRRAHELGKATSFVTELADMGCNVYPIGCNISCKDELVETLDYCREFLPPIRGVIQGAMVLQVCPPITNTYFLKSD